MPAINAPKTEPRMVSVHRNLVMVYPSVAKGGSIGAVERARYHRETEVRNGF